uniref:ORF1ab polyprotein n=9 Tax=Orthocoronavirinae TaxID=2501931 RepID=A0AB39AG74_9NIDO
MANKSRPRGILVIPELTNNSSLLLLLAAAKNGRNLTDPQSIQFLGNYKLNFRLAKPGEHVMDKDISLAAFEDLFGVQPYARVIRDLIRDASWADTKPSLVAKAKQLPSMLDAPALRACVRFGNPRISTLASLAIFYNVVQVEEVELLSILEEMMLQRAYKLNLGDALAYVRKLNCVQTKDFLSLGIAAFDEEFSTRLKKAATIDGPTLQLGDLVMWKEATAKRSVGGLVHYSGRSRPFHVEVTIQESITLVPIELPAVKDSYSGAEVTILGFSYLKVKADTPYYLPIVGDKVLLSAHRASGTPMVPTRVVFHTEPDADFKLFIAAQTLLNDAIVDWENGCVVDDYTTVVVGPSKPGDIVVTEDTFFQRFPRLKRAYKAFRESAYIVFMKARNQLDKILPWLAELITALNEWAQAVSSTLAWSIVRVVDAIMEKSLLVLMKAEKLSISVVDGLLVTNSKFWNAIFQPLLALTTEAMYQAGNTTVLLFEQSALLVVDGTLSVLQAVDAGLVNCAYGVQVVGNLIHKTLTTLKPSTFTSWNDTAALHVGNCIVTCPFDGENVLIGGRAYKLGGSDDPVQALADLFVFSGNYLDGTFLVASSEGASSLLKNNVRFVGDQHEFDGPDCSVVTFVNKATFDESKCTFIGVLTEASAVAALCKMRNVQADNVSVSISGTTVCYAVKTYTFLSEAFDEKINEALNSAVRRKVFYYQTYIGLLEKLAATVALTTGCKDKFVVINARTDAPLTEEEACDGTLTLILQVDDDDALVVDEEEYQADGDEDGGYVPSLEPQKYTKPQLASIQEQTESEESDYIPMVDDYTQVVDAVGHDDTIVDVDEEDVSVSDSADIQSERHDQCGDHTGIDNSESQSTFNNGNDDTIVGSDSDSSDASGSDVLIDDTDASADSDSGDKPVTTVNLPVLSTPYPVATPASPTKVTFHVGDLSSVQVCNDAILVNPANEHLTNGGGAARAISQLAGVEYQQYCNTQAPIKGLFVTPPFQAEKLGYSCIAHIVPPTGRMADVKNKLYQAYKSVLVQPGNYVLPILGVGIYGCNVVDSLQAFREACPPDIGHVTLVTLDKNHADVWCNLTKAVVKVTKDFDQVTTAHMGPAEIKQARLFDGEKFIEEAGDAIYLQVTDATERAAANLGLTLSQYFKMLQYTSIKWNVSRRNGLMILKQSHNNCYVASAIAFMQMVNYKPLGAVATLFNSFLNGNPAEFVAYCYAASGQVPGQMGDALAILDVLFKDYVVRGTTDCCGSTFQHEGLLYTAKVDPSVVMHCYKCSANAGVKFLTPAIVAGGSSDLHYEGPAVYHSKQSVHWVSARKHPGGDFTCEAIYIPYHEPRPQVVTIPVTLNPYEPLNIETSPEPVVEDVDVRGADNDPPPSQPQESNTSTATLENPDAMDLLSVWIEKPVSIVVKSWQVLGRALFRANTVLKFSGVVASRIYNYLCNVGLIHNHIKLSASLAVTYVKNRTPFFRKCRKVLTWVGANVLHGLSNLYPCYWVYPATLILKALFFVGVFLLAKTGLPCEVVEPPYNMATYCADKGIFCQPCLSGYDSLHFYQHLMVQQIPVKVDLFWTYAVHVIALFSNPYLVLGTLIGVFLLNLYSVEVFFFGTIHLPYWPMVYVVLAIYYLCKVYMYLQHISVGCKNPTCKLCIRKNIARRVTVEVLLQGRKHYTTVNTNGGTAFCEKHAFFCENCEKGGVDATYIPIEVVESLSKATSLAPKPTGPAYVISTDVTQQGEFVQARGVADNRTYTTVFRQSDVVTTAQVAKSTYSHNVVIAANLNDAGALRCAKEYAVLLSIELGRVVFIIDHSYDTKQDNFNAVKAVLEKFYVFKDISSTGDLASDIARATDGLVTDDVLKAALIAVERDIEFTVDPPNNTIPHYAFDFASVGTDDQVLLKQHDCGSGVMKGTGINCVLPANLVRLLTPRTIVKLRNAASRNGVRLCVSPCNRVLRTSIPVVPFNIKVGGSKHVNKWALLVAGYILAIGLSYFFTWLVTPVPPSVVVDIPATDFRLIRNGVFDVIRSTDNCFSNKFASFGSWLNRPFVNSPDCPVVVGAISTVGAQIAGLPGQVMWRNNALIHVFDKFSASILGDLSLLGHASWNIKNAVGYTASTVVTGNSYLNSIALYNSECVYLRLDDKRELYCYDRVNDQHRLYADIQPHVTYTVESSDGKLLPLVVPDQIMYTPYIVRFVQAHYCRMGHCFDTKPGICLSFIHDFISYTDDLPPGVFCGDNVLHLMTNAVVGSIAARDAFKSTTALMCSTGAIIACVLVVLFVQKLFKGYTTFVLIVILNAVINLVLLYIYMYMPVLAIILYGVYCYAVLICAPMARTVAIILMAVTIIPLCTNTFIITCVAIILIYACGYYGYVVLSTGRADFTSFASASKSTFVIDTKKYVELMNLAGSDFDAYLASYAKYRYYSGAADTSEYGKVCIAFLAKALDSFKASGGTGSVLYTPPKLAVVQAGIKKLLSPSGMVEQCVVSVVYRGSNLNGLWLHDTIYVPRHILGKYTASQWQDVVNLADCRDFTIFSPLQGVNLTVTSVRLQGAILQLKVHAKNLKTPTYKFERAKPGDPMTIACAYDGIVRSIYHVVLQNNGLIFGSFLNGACGSVGYTIRGSTLVFYYMHHIEFSNKTHGGSTLDGYFYGSYVDEERAQHIPAMAMITDNVLAHIYTHLLTLTTKPTWLSATELSVTDFNEWAQNNSYTTYPSSKANQDYLEALAATTRVSVARCLATIVSLHANWGEASILGYNDFECDMTPEMVYNQAPINLQANYTKIFSWLAWVIYSLFYFAILWCVTPQYYATSIVCVSVSLAILTMVLVKHTTVFLLGFVCPLVVVTARYSYILFIPNSVVRRVLFYLFEDVFVNFSFFYVVAVVVFVVWLQCIRGLYECMHKRYYVTTLLDFVYRAVWAFYVGYELTQACTSNTLDVGHVFHLTMLLSPSPITSHIAFALSYYVVQPLDDVYIIPIYVIRLLVFYCIGLIITMRYGVLWFINKLTGIPVGTYKFMVSRDELKYMMATRMKPPTNAIEVIWTNFKLLGVGGKREIVVSTVQNRTLDAKATAVLVANMLDKVGALNKHEVSKKIVACHNATLKAETYEQAESNLVQLLVYLIEYLTPEQIDTFLDSLLQNAVVLQVVSDSAIALDSYRVFKEAEAAYHKSVEDNEPLPEQKKKLKVANIAKAEWDRDAAANRKLEKLADQAMKAMYLAERSEDRRIKLTSGLTSMLYHMLRRVNSDRITALFECAKSHVVPIHAIAGSSTEGLKLIIDCKETFDRYVINNSVVYRGTCYNIVKVVDLDNANVALPPTVYPVVIECTAAIKCQNNELCVRNVYTAQACGIDNVDKQCDVKSFYVTHNGKKICVAVTADVDNLTSVVLNGDAGKVVLTLEPPLKFSHVVGGKLHLVYLYFVKDIRSIFRGMVIGHISSTSVLQANGTAIEYQQNASLLTYLAFAADPKDAYLKHVQSGGKPLLGAVKMVAPNGEGFAVTTKPQPSANQYSYGGASVCIYCRAHVPHNTTNGQCLYKGRFVQIDKDLDPFKFLLEHQPCNSCQRWQSHDCTCGADLQSNAYLNRVKGSSGARLEPMRPGSQPDPLVRAFHVYNNKNVGIFTNVKTNCARHQVLGTHYFFVTKQCDEVQFRKEEHFYSILPQHFKGDVVPHHDFFKFDGTPNVVRQYLTKYTLLDLVYALRHLSDSVELLREILQTHCGTPDTFFEGEWYDPIENVHFYTEFHKLGVIINRCVLKANAFVDTANKLGFLGVLTPDNQDLEGKIYDFGDYMQSKSVGCIDMESYYSYLMPAMSMTHMLKIECMDGDNFKEYPIDQYDFTEYKLKLFKKYFPFWNRTYHPNTIDCQDDRCILHCANFNILFAMCIPSTAFGNLCAQATVDGHPIIQTVGLHSKELGIIFNTDVVTHMTNLNLTTLIRLVGDPTTHTAVADACVDFRTPCQTLASILSGATKQSVRPGHFNQHFYERLIESGLLDELNLDIRHFYFMQDGEAAIKDYSYYRYNTPTMVDISMFLFCVEVANCYLSVYEGGCISAQNVVVNNLDKSAGFPFNKLGKARNYYDLTYKEQDELFEYTKRNVLPTMTQMNLKYAISAKDRARTVAGVSIVSTMTNRQYHQKLLKSISLARNQTIVIGTTKFYGGWNAMLKNLTEGISNPLLFGWDYPKCDRSMPNILRIASSLLLARKHTCCTTRQRFYRLANECCQVLSEVVLSGNVLYVKPGGTSSGDATTAYANSVFNILQVVSANVATFLSTSTHVFEDASIAALHRMVYETIYRGDSNDLNVVQLYHRHLKAYCGLMILSDDGVACIDQDAASQHAVATLKDFRDLLFYQNNVYMADSKCWVEADLSVGPHEFCSQHTILTEIDGEPYYLPYPDASRILSACVFVDDFNKADPIQNLERYISLAIDAYPLTKVSPSQGKIFYLLLDYIKHLARELNDGIFESFQTVTDMSYIDGFVQESFYSQMYETAPTLQATGACTVCSSPTILRCGDCIRRPLLCCVCCYQHVTRTTHKRVIAINNYICSVEGCNQDNVEFLYISGTSVFCNVHKPALCVPIVANGTVFGIYRHTARGSSDIDIFNQLAVSDYSTVEPYKLANNAPISLMLFAAETIKAKEEAIKRSYASATVKDAYDGRIVKLIWENGKKVPPITKNHVFTGYHFSKNGKTQVGDYVLQRCDGDSYIYRGTSTYKLQPNDVLVLMAHVVTPLSAPPVVSQTNYTRANLRPDTVAAASYLNHFKSYNEIALRKVTTVLGPPGTGKSTFAIGLACYYPGARVCYTASSHAAIDALCQKALHALPVENCTRIVPTRTTVDCFQEFTVNNTSAKYVFSTINALPDIKCDIVVVDEISMLTNYELSSVNARLSYSHIVYVGDPYQLPSPRTMLTGGQLEPTDYNVVTTIMVKVGADVMLDRCYRCPAEIVSTVSKLVYDNKLLAVKPKSHMCYKVIINYGSGDISYDGLSAYNNPQLEFAIAFRNFKQWSDVTFISPYNAMNTKASLAGFSTQTVDSSQGSEYNYVIFCVTTDSGHALNMSRLNVALTRAKQGILVIFRQKSKLYDQLEFEELDAAAVGNGGGIGGTDASVQAEVDRKGGTQPTNLFKLCKNDYEGQLPHYALNWNDLGPSYKCGEDLAKIFGIELDANISYKYLVSMLGLLPSDPIPMYHNFFLTKDEAKQYVQSWVGFDVEAAHAIKPNTGTNLPLQLGFSNGVNFSVKPEGFWVTETGTVYAEVPAKIPPGEQFSHLRKDMKHGEPWSVVRTRIVTMLSKLLRDTDYIVFVTWAHQLELTTMRYFVRIGPDCRCDCGRRAVFSNYTASKVGCKTHCDGLDYCYNPFIIDCATWGYSGSLSSNHDSVCTYHANAHVASSDAQMTVCLAIHHLFSVVDWDTVYPTTVEQDLLNKACRLVQANYMRILLTTLNTNVVYDIGNPKGLKTVRDPHIQYHFFDKNPVSPKVTRLTYDSSMAPRFKDGLAMFWNCNVDAYPDNALVCRYDTHRQAHLIGPNGAALYVNKHAFLTPPLPAMAVHRLRLAPMVFYSETPCSTEQPIVIGIRDCITKCNTGSTICPTHVAEYDVFVKAYTLMSRVGFNVYVPRNINLYNCWVKFSNLQTLENLAYNVYYKNHNANVRGELDVVISNNVVSAKVEGRIVKLFENTTILPVSVAFEHYTNRNISVIPTASLLVGLGVSTTVNFTVWLNGDTLFSQTVNVSTYTDVNTNDIALLDERYKSTLSDFLKLDNAVFLSPTHYKKYGPTPLSQLQQCGNPVYGELLYLYVRRDGRMVQPQVDYYTQGRTMRDFMPRTTMEIDFMSMTPEDFVAKYELQNLGVEHILYGDVTSRVIGGCHALISLVHRKLSVDSVVVNAQPVQNAIIMSSDGKSKEVCTFVDLTIDDYIAIIRHAHSLYQTQSKVFYVNIDGHNTKFVIWHDDVVRTCYPVLQSLVNGYQMPSIYKTLTCERTVCDIENYHVWKPSIPGVYKNVLKYRQLLAYIIKKDRLAVPHNMTVLHLGAASAEGVAPGTAVLRQYFPEGTRIVDLDLREFVSDANQCVVKDYRTFMPPEYVDCIFSDMYSTEPGFFDNLVHIVTKTLALGGSLFVKMTEHSYSQQLYDLAGTFEQYELFCTGVNASSSEVWLCCFNYLSRLRHIVPSDMHANYIKWRNENPLKPVYSTLADSVYNVVKLKATPVIGFNEINSKPILYTLVASGRLLVRPPCTGLLF